MGRTNHASQLKTKIMTDQNYKAIMQLSDREKICLHGYLRSISTDPSEKNILWAKRWAYISSRKRQILDTSEKYITSSSFTVNLSKWFKSNPVQSFLAEYGAEVHIQTNENVESVSKDELLKELTKIFRTERDPKLKSEIAMKLADLQAYKKDTVTETKAEQRHFYSPLKCSTCKTLLSVTNCANCIHTFTNKNPNLNR